MNNRKAGMLIFYSGLLIGMAALVHFPSVIFFLLPYFAIVSMGPFPPVVWMLGLTGFLLPYYYVFSLQFLFSSWDPGVVWMGFRPSLPSLFSSGTGPWSWAALLLPLVVGLWHLNRHVFRMLIRNRKCWNLYIIQLACASLAPFLFASQGAAIWISIAPGLAAYHANAYIQPRRRWIPELLHWGCLVAVVIAHLSI